MSLTQAQMDAIDEAPTIRGFPAVMSFTPIRAEVRKRSRPPRWAIQAAARRRQLGLMACQLEMEAVIYGELEREER